MLSHGPYILLRIIYTYQLLPYKFNDTYFTSNIQHLTTYVYHDHYHSIPAGLSLSLKPMIHILFLSIKKRRNKNECLYVSNKYHDLFSEIDI